MLGYVFVLALIGMAVLWFLRVLNIIADSLREISECVRAAWSQATA